MRKFERGAAPESLAKARRERKSWDQFAHTDAHKELRDRLYEAQGERCAYCETNIKSSNGDINGHIEHLIRRNDAPEKTFDWNNLFFSCNHDESCGRYKDNPKNKITFNGEDIVDPSREKPSEFFTYDANGKIVERGDVSETAKRRALETIRVFNLNLPKLQNARKRAAEIVANLFNHGFLNSEKEIDEFLTDQQNSPYLSVYYALCGRELE